MQQLTSKKVDDEEEDFRHKVEEQEIDNNNNELEIIATEDREEVSNEVEEDISEGQ